MPPFSRDVPREPHFHAVEIEPAPSNQEEFDDDDDDEESQPSSDDESEPESVYDELPWMSEVAWRSMIFNDGIRQHVKELIVTLPRRHWPLLRLQGGVFRISLPRI